LIIKVSKVDKRNPVSAFAVSFGNFIKQIIGAINDNERTAQFERRSSKRLQLIANSNFKERIAKAHKPNKSHHNTNPKRNT
jgi:hypothetical protein